MGDIADDGINPYNATNITNDQIAQAIASEYTYNILLWGPFVLIPGCILGARLVKYLYKLHQSWKYGYDEDLFDDPLRQLGLAQLGITLNRGYDDLNDIRKIRKEQKKLEKRILNKDRKPEKDSLLSEVPKSSIAPAFIARPLFLAENYLATFYQQTQRTWTDHFSPEAISRWFESSAFGRFWMMFQVACTLISIVNYVFLTYTIQNDERVFIKYLDVVLAGIFLTDYAISIYIAEDRLAFYFNYSSLVDLISIVPPFIYLFIGEHSQFFWFLGLLRILRASRILRTYRLLSFSETEEKREITIVALTFCNFIFLSTSIINALETINVERKTEASLLNWHDSLYYIMVTFSTIGFGDLTPSSTLSRVVVIILIVFVVIYVPVQTNRISEIYSASSAFQRAKFSPKSKGSSHVVLSGAVNYSAIVDFAREFFAASTDVTTKIVVLAQSEPDLDTRRLLRHPSYRSRLQYLFGSALSIADLKRAAAKYATALFLINQPASTFENDEEQTSVTRNLDNEILMQSLVAKKTFPGIPILSQVLDIGSEDLSLHCGSDKVLCCDKLKLSIMARECLVPGFLAFILNLVCKYSNERLHMHENEPWTYEYALGASNQIFSFRVPPGFCSMKWEEVVESAFKAFNITIFAMMPLSGIHSGKIRINPGKDYVLGGDEVLFCLTSGGDEVILRLAIQFKDAIPRTQLEMLQLDNELSEKVTPRVTVSAQGDSGFLTILEHPKQPGHIILCGNLSIRRMHQFISNIRNASLAGQPPTKIVCLLKQPIETSSLGCTTETGLWEHVKNDENVEIVIGSALKKASLLACGIETCNRIVIFPTPTKSKLENAPTLQDANSVFIIKMIQENWPTTNFVVELLSGINVRYFSSGSQRVEWDTENLRMQSILNNYSLSITDRLSLYKKMRQYRNENGLFQLLYGFIWSKPSTIQTKEINKNENSSIMSVESTKPILKKGPEKKINEKGLLSAENEDRCGEDDRGGHSSTSFSTAYLQKLVEEAELNESGFSLFISHHFDKNFAMGRVMPVSFLHSLLAQSYFRPFIGEIVSHLSNSVLQIVAPEEFIGIKYSELFANLVKRDLIPLGLNRTMHKGQSWRTEGKEESDAMRYVYTNCRGHDLVEKDDLVYVVPKHQD
ncbi:hypothetical protein HDU82_007513 [Entophlyctis luteolus]|nr:hypothetical protein HDU82_007513 [Entophlyctis luteolus]